MRPVFPLSVAIAAFLGSVMAYLSGIVPNGWAGVICAGVSGCLTTMALMVQGSEAYNDGLEDGGMEDEQ